MRSGRDYQAALAAGTRTRVGGLTVVQAPGSEGPSRVGLVVTRRVGGAVRRNRAKRRLRAAVTRIAWPPGNDYVVIASAAVSRAAFGELVQWLEQSISREEDQGG